MENRSRPYADSSNPLQPDKQQIWLTIALIATCVCLITTILIISVFVYREINKNSQPVKSNESDSRDSLKVDVFHPAIYEATVLPTTQQSTVHGIRSSLTNTQSKSTEPFSTLSTILMNKHIDKSKIRLTLKNDDIITGSITSTDSYNTKQYTVAEFNSAEQKFTITTESYKSAEHVENPHRNSTSSQPISTETAKLTETTIASKSLTTITEPVTATSSNPTTAEDSFSEQIVQKPEKLVQLESQKKVTQASTKASSTETAKLAKTTIASKPLTTITEPLTATSSNPLTAEDSFPEQIVQKPEKLVQLENQKKVTHQEDLNETSSNLDSSKDPVVTTATTTIIKYIEKLIPAPEIKVCDTITCKRSASKMIALIDHNLDPCEDFYSYACNGIEVNRLKNPQYDSVVLEKLEAIDQSTDKINIKFQNHLKACKKLNYTEGLSFLKKTTKDIFHMADKGDKRDSLTKAIIKILQLDLHRSSFDLLPVFDVKTVFDSNSKKFIPMLTIPTANPASANGFSAIEFDCIQSLEPGDGSAVVRTLYEEYENCIRNVSRHVNKYHGKLKDLFVDSPELLKPDSVWKKFATIPKTVTRREWNQYSLKTITKYVDYSIKDMHEKYPEINWAILIATLFKGKEWQISKIRIMFKDSFDQIFEFYRKNSLSDLITILRLITTYDLYLETFGEYDWENVRDYCLKLTMKSMEDLAANLLLSKTNKKDLEFLDEKAAEIFKNLREQFTKSLRNSNWLNEENNKILLSKLERLEVLPKAKTIYFNDNSIETRNMNLTITENFVENQFNIRRNRRVIANSMIDNIAPNDMWFFQFKPLSTEIWTIFEDNKIILPPGLLMKLAFKKRRSPQQYEIYARLGFELARGIAKFFEPSRLSEMLTTIEDNEVYKNYLHIRLGDPQIAKANNEYAIEATKEDLVLSQNSRFVDDLAVRLAIDTYNKTALDKDIQFLWLNYTIPQLFYLSLAQEFCKPKVTTVEIGLKLFESSDLPQHFRLNSLLMNSLRFSDVYRCPTGSTMNPAFKADAFPYITYTDIDYV